MLELMQRKPVCAAFCVATWAFFLVGPDGDMRARAGETVNPKEATFTFAPPDGTKFVQTLVKTSDKIFEGLGRQTDVSKSDTSILIRRATNGFVITATPNSMKMTRNGEPIAHPISELMKSVVVTYRVDSNGSLTGIEGFGGLLDELQKTTTPEVVAALAPALNEQTLVARETSEWNGRFGDFAGATVEIGDTYVSEIPFTLANGEAITYSRVIFIPGWEDCPGGSCLRVKVLYDSDGQALSKLASEMTSSLLDLKGNEPGTAATTDSRISGEASWLIDPANMLIYTETRARTMTLTLEIPGRGPVPTTIEERSQYSFDYE